MKIGNTEISLITKEYSSEELKTKLKYFYDVCNKVFVSNDVFYSSEEVKKLKKDKNNIFL